MRLSRKTKIVSACNLVLFTTWKIIYSVDWEQVTCQSLIFKVKGIEKWILTFVIICQVKNNKMTYVSSQCLIPMVRGCLPSQAALKMLFPCYVFEYSYPHRSSLFSSQSWCYNRKTWNDTRVSQTFPWPVKQRWLPERLPYSPKSIPSSPSSSSMGLSSQWSLLLKYLFSSPVPLSPAAV